MTAEHEDGRQARDERADSQEAIELVEAYCTARSQGAAIAPEDWLRARGGDRSLGEELRIIDLLRDASSLEEDGASVDTTHAWQPPTPANVAPALASDQPTLLPGELLDGKLRILDRLGAGGMGEVYVAWHEVLEREVAVKVLLGDQAADESSIGRFRKSIAMQARISSHQHIVGTLDAGVHRGHIYLVTEYVPGADLATILQARDPVPWREVTEWIRQAAVGLEHAHQAGLVHRDIKPSNMILAGDGTIKLLDWGLARSHSGDADDGRTAANVALGTFDYMAPEQARDAATADARSDLYSLGCTFYQMLAGRAPFGHHKSKLAKVQAHGSEPPPLLATLRHDVPGSVQSVITRLLQKDPALRYATARELADELEAILAGESTPRVTQGESRRRVLLPMSVAMCAVLLAFTARYFWPPNTASLLDWERLELLTAEDPTDKNLPYDPVNVVIEGGFRQKPASIRTFGGPAGFRLDGLLNQPTSWAVVWIDDPAASPRTDATTRVNLHLVASGSGRTVAYPGSGVNEKLITVMPSSTPGVHDVVLVLVADPTQANVIEADGDWLVSQIQTLSPQDWPLPPKNFPGMICTPSVDAAESAWRSPGAEVDGHTTNAYLQQIESRLPAGVRPLAAFFVRTEPAAPDATDGAQPGAEHAP